MQALSRLVPWNVARDRLLRASRPIQRIERCSLPECSGRIAARIVRAPRSIPPFPRATWDGYALRSSDLRGASASHRVPLRIVGELYAEQTLGRAIGPGEAVAIATGAQPPRGADAVEIFERVRRHGSSIEISAPVPRGQHIAKVGDDVARGSLLCSPGEPLTPAALGALAASGFTRVDLWAKPRVAIVPNGDELRLPGRELGPGAIYESNNATLGAIVAAAGGAAHPLPPMRDDPRRIEAVLRRALASHDVVIATGGSSVGEHDYLPSVFPKLGKMLFHGIAVRPGKPTLAARCGERLLIGMPGHPTSCLSNGLWLLLPLLRRIARQPGPEWTTEELRLAAPIERPSPDLATVVPFAVRGGRAIPTYHDSHALRSYAGVGAFLILEPGQKPPRRGDKIRVHRLWPPLAPTAPGEVTTGRA